MTSAITLKLVPVHTNFGRGRFLYAVVTVLIFSQGLLSTIPLEKTSQIDQKILDDTKSEGNTESQK